MIFPPLHLFQMHTRHDSWLLRTEIGNLMVFTGDGFDSAEISNVAVLTFLILT